MRYSATTQILSMLECASNILDHVALAEHYSAGIAAESITFWENAIESDAHALRARGVC